MEAGPLNRSDGLRAQERRSGPTGRRSVFGTSIPRLLIQFVNARRICSACRIPSRSLMSLNASCCQSSTQNVIRCFADGIDAAKKVMLKPYDCQAVCVAGLHCFGFAAEDHLQFSRDPTDFGLLPVRCGRCVLCVVQRARGKRVLDVFHSSGAVDRPWSGSLAIKQRAERYRRKRCHLSVHFPLLPALPCREPARLWGTSFPFGFFLPIRPVGDCGGIRAWKSRRRSEKF
jgi:hypothetical protein